MKKHYLVLQLIIIILMMAVLLSFFSDKNLKQQTFQTSTVENQDVKDHLIISLFLQPMGKALDDYYLEYLSNGVKLFPYYVDIIEMQSLRNNATLIKFGVTPQIGSHTPVGYDEITYTVSSTGDISLDSYEHKKTYPLPSRYEDIVIKPLPQ
ncbi:MAG: DUF3888 domain-containing protein [Lachnotalea sp.]